MSCSFSIAPMNSLLCAWCLHMVGLHLWTFTGRSQDMWTNHLKKPMKEMHRPTEFIVPSLHTNHDLLFWHWTTWRKKTATGLPATPCHRSHTDKALPTLAPWVCSWHQGLGKAFWKKPHTQPAHHSTTYPSPLNHIPLCCPSTHFIPCRTHTLNGPENGFAFLLHSHQTLPHVRTLVLRRLVSAILHARWNPVVIHHNILLKWRLFRYSKKMTHYSGISEELRGCHNAVMQTFHTTNFWEGSTIQCMEPPLKDLRYRTLQ